MLSLNDLYDRNANYVCYLHLMVFHRLFQLYVNSYKTQVIFSFMLLSCESLMLHLHILLYQDMISLVF
jgi:hypothetical protein